MKKLVGSLKENSYRLREVQTDMFVANMELTLSKADYLLPWFKEEETKHILEKISDEKPTWKIEITKRTNEREVYEEPIEYLAFMEGK